MKLILLGAPGAGKGTQAAFISKKLGIPTISTGDILRAAVKAGTPVGLKAESYMKAGKLVPDDVIMDIIRERVKESDCAEGYIFDGMPRTIAQAEALEAHGIEVETALSLEIEDEVIIERLSGRRVCRDCGATCHVINTPPRKEGICDVCGGPLIIRADDNPETIRSRLETYHKETEPLKDFYAARGKLISVENQPTSVLTSEAVFRALGI